MYWFLSQSIPVYTAGSITCASIDFGRLELIYFKELKHRHIEQIEQENVDSCRIWFSIGPDSTASGD